MSKLRERLLYELAKQPKERKASLHTLIGRLLLGFFILMILLTFVSRAADSITIAKVGVTNMKRGILNFKVEGNATLEENAQKYLDIYDGIRIEAIFVDKGQTVSKGDAIFQYDRNDLAKKQKGFEEEMEIARINYEKGKLSYKATNSETTAEAASVNLERASLDLEASKKDLEYAKEKVKKDKENTYKAAENNYKEASEAYEDMVSKKDKEIEMAKEEVTQSEDTLNELYKKKREAETVISDYKKAIEGKEKGSTASAIDYIENTNTATAYNINSDFISTITNINNGFYNTINSAQVAPENSVVNSDGSKEKDPVMEAVSRIYMNYYGTADFEKHLKEVSRAKKNIDRIKEDFLITLINASETGGMLTTSEKAALLRSYQDAYEALTDLTEKDLEISKAINAYGDAVQNLNTTEALSAYDKLFTLLYEEDDNMKKTISDADKALVKAKKSADDLTKDWERTLLKEQDKLTEALEEYKKEESIYNQILNNTYDFTYDVKLEKRQVESAERAVEDAKSAVVQAKKNDENIEETNSSQKQMENLDLKLAELELQKKEKSLKAIKEILKNNGIITAPVNGTMITIGIQSGILTTGTEIVSIAVDNLGFRAQVTKEEAKRLSVGDEIVVKVGNNTQETAVSLEHIGSEDNSEFLEISGIMPEGEYTVGTAVTFMINKQSERYDQVIPIQALKRDIRGVYYILTTQERNTILGTELVAVRKEITLLDKDYTTAAIECSLSPKEDIILTSNKIIEEGDRVRLVEGID